MDIWGHPQFPLGTGQTTPCSVRLTIMTLAWSTSDRAKASQAHVEHTSMARRNRAEVVVADEVGVYHCVQRVVGLRGPGRSGGYPPELPQIRTCGTRNSSRHTSSTHLPGAYNRVFGTSPPGRVVPGPSPEGSTRRTIMRRSRTITVPPRARSVQLAAAFRANFG